jgi:predicted RNA binding protein YcfA (HicA-like mRNA interferase family)
MPVLRAVKRSDLIRYLLQLGFSGPYSGGKHQFMMRNEKRVTLPNPHRQEISTNLLARLLRQAKIEKSEWEAL